MSKEDDNIIGVAVGTTIASVVLSPFLGFGMGLYLTHSMVQGIGLGLILMVMMPITIALSWCLYLWKAK